MRSVHRRTPQPNVGSGSSRVPDTRLADPVVGAVLVGRKWSAAAFVDHGSWLLGALRSSLAESGPSRWMRWPGSGRTNWRAAEREFCCSRNPRLATRRKARRETARSARCAQLPWLRSTSDFVPMRPRLSATSWNKGHREGDQRRQSRHRGCDRGAQAGIPLADRPFDARDCRRIRNNSRRSSKPTACSVE